MSVRSYCSSNSDASDFGENIYCIFLHISEGVGFNTKDVIGDYKELNTSHVLLKASLNGVQFEIDGYCNTLETKFNSNCIWECKVSDIKRMKSDNRPIKLECFSKCHRSGIVCDKLIGSLLLPLKYVPVTSKLTYGPPKLKWHKLGTLAVEWRYSKPEISLLLMVVRKCIIERGQMELFLRRHKISKTGSPKPSETAYMLQSQRNVYIQLLEQDGLIQVGNNPEEDCETFLLTLTFKHVRNVEGLLNPNTQQHHGNMFVFSYDLLGQVSNVDIWMNYGNGDCYVVNEKVSVNFKSSLKSLRMFFEKIFYIPIYIYSNGIEVAKYRFDFAKLFPTHENYIDDKANTWTTNGEFYFDRVNTELGVSSPSRLSVDYTFTIQNLQMESIPRNRCVTPSLEDAPGAQTLDEKISPRNPKEYCEPSVPGGETSLVKKCTEDNYKDRVAKTFCYASTNTEPSAFVDFEELSLKVVQELEQWKSQQMQTFITELSRKGNKFQENFQQNILTMHARLESKIALCDQLNSQLEAMIREFNESTIKNQEHLKIVDTMKHEMEANYEKKFIEIGAQMESLKSEIQEKDRSTDIDNTQSIETKAENVHLKRETLELKARIKVLQQNLTVSQNTNNIPIQQLINIISDLGKQSERLTVAEKSSHYYQEQWADVSHEINKLKLELVNLQEAKTAAKDLRSNDLSLILHEIINDEQDSLSTERSELKSIRSDLLNSIGAVSEDDDDTFVEFE